MSWYHHLTILPLGKHVTFIKDIFSVWLTAKKTCVSQGLTHVSGILLMLHY